MPRADQMGSYSSPASCEVAGPMTFKTGCQTLDLDGTLGAAIPDFVGIQNSGITKVDGSGLIITTLGITVDLTARLQRVSWPRWKALSGVAGPALGDFLAQSRSSRPREFVHWFEFCPPGDF